MWASPEPDSLILVFYEGQSLLVATSSLHNLGSTDDPEYVDHVINARDAYVIRTIHNLVGGWIELTQPGEREIQRAWKLGADSI